MKKNLFIALLLALSTLAGRAQVTQINANKSLQTGFPLTNNKAVFISTADSSLWATDGTAAGTIQLSSAIRAKGIGGVINSKLIFSGTSAEYGTEVFITDGTAGGTTILKDINPGTGSSSPDEDFALLNGTVYFTATAPGTGRELWRTDGTNAGTTLVKDIVAGPTGSNDANKYELFSSNSYLLLAVKTATYGTEIWKSDGTEAGTVMLKDINTGALSSNPTGFQVLNNVVLFAATSVTQGQELWRTDGTDAGTVLVKDINPNAPGSSISTFFYIFNNKAYFSANNGVAGSELWSTDGTAGGTALLKDIEPGMMGSFTLLLNAVKTGNKFIFGAFTMNEGFELWESDGTTDGTKLFKDIIPGSEGSSPFIFSPGLSFLTGGSQPLFQGNKFFFMADTEDHGTELWVSDGTIAGTRMVKDINPNAANGIAGPSYIYTTTALYFAAEDNTKGNELWKTDGTEGGTSMVADINVGAGDSEPMMVCLLNGKLLFSASDGDVPNRTDLYVLDGNLVPLPLKLTELTVVQRNNDAVLHWATAQEVDMKDFTIQRSFDGANFSNAGSVAAVGTSHTRQNYSFTDAGVMNSGKDVVYYRLVSSGKDGKNEISRIISLKLKGAAVFTAKLVSNPVQNEVRVMLSGSSQRTQLSVKDLHGRTVYTSEAKGNGLISLPATQLPRGMYVLVAENKQDRITVSFLKQ